MNFKSCLVFSILKIFILVKVSGTTGRLVTVNHGQIIMSHNGSCHFTVNDQSFNYTCDQGHCVLPGLFFGYIKFECDTAHIGVLVSKFICKECGLFCNYNQKISSCQHDITIIIFGFLAGILCFLIFALLFSKRIKKILHQFVDWIIFKFHIRKHNRVISRSNKLRSKFNIDSVPNFSLPATVHQKYHKQFTLSTSRLNISQPGDDHVETSFSKIDRSACTSSSVKPDNVYTEGSGKAGTSSVTSLAMTSVLAGSLIFGNNILQSDACDFNLYVHSPGLICKSEMCESLEAYQFYLEADKTTCLRDANGNILSLKLSDAYILNRHMLQYYTSDFEIKVSSYYNCLGSGPACWNNCDYSSKGDFPDTSENDTLNSISGYSCLTNVMRCDSYCFHGISCTYLKWDLKPVGEPSEVYSKVSEIWEAVIKINFKNLTFYKAFNVNKPRDSFSLSELSGLSFPIYVSDFDSEKLTSDGGLVRYHNKFYEMEVAPRNFPNSKLIGDIQIPIHGGVPIYDTHDIKCSVKDCKAVCLAPSPRLSRLSNLQDRQVPHYYYIQDSTVVVTKTSVKASVSVIMGTSDLYRSLFVSPAYCRVELLMTYDCVGCLIRPYAIFQASHITSEGVLNFESNCTFDRDYISCDENPYILKLESNVKFCSFYIPSINRSIPLRFDTIYLGSLDPLESLVSETAIGITKGILTNSNFWNSLLSTISVFSCLTIIGTMVIKIFQIYLTARAQREINVA